MTSSKKPLIDPTLAPRLRELCDVRRVSCSDLARRTDINRTTLTRILRGQRCAHPTELSRILKGLRIRRREFLSRPSWSCQVLSPSERVLVPRSARDLQAPLPGPRLTHHEVKLRASRRAVSARVPGRTDREYLAHNL